MAEIQDGRQPDYKDLWGRGENRGVLGSGSRRKANKALAEGIFGDFQNDRPPLPHLSRQPLAGHCSATVGPFDSLFGALAAEKYPLSA